MSCSGQERPAPVSWFGGSGRRGGPRAAWDADGRGRGGGEGPVSGVQRDGTRRSAPSDGEVMVENVTGEDGKR